MYPDTSYAGGRGSFLRPVPIPSGQPDATPNKSITVACEWLPYVRGALQQLLLQATWQTDDPAALLDIQGRVSNLIDLFSECSSSVLPFTCDWDYTLSDGSWILNENTIETPDTFGEYVAGAGWFSTYTHYTSSATSWRGINIVKIFSPPVTLHHAQFTYDLTKGSFDFGGFNNQLNGYLSGVQQFNVATPSISDPDGTNKTLAYSSAGVSIDLLEIYLITGDNLSGADPGGQVNVKQAAATGVGAATCS